MNEHFSDYKAYGQKSLAFGTIIQQLIQPFRGARTRIKGFKYTAAGTAHVVTIRMPIGVTSVAVPAASGATTVTLNAQQPTGAVGRTIAANDYLCFDRADTTYANSAGTATFLVTDLYKVSGTPVVAPNGQITVTLSTALTAAIAAGMPLGSGIQPDGSPVGGNCWLMSLDTDVIPVLGIKSPKYNLPANAGTDIPTNILSAAGLIETPFNYSPVILESNNITATGFFEYIVTGGFIPTAPRR